MLHGACEPVLVSALEDQRDDDDDDDERPDAERDVAAHGLIPFVDNECPNPPGAKLFRACNHMALATSEQTEAGDRSGSSANGKGRPLARPPFPSAGASRHPRNSVQKLT